MKDQVQRKLVTQREIVLSVDEVESIIRNKLELKGECRFDWELSEGYVDSLKIMNFTEEEVR